LAHVTSTDRATDALRKLRISLKDQSYIDLTRSPPPSPRVKQEHGSDGVKAEDAERNVKPKNEHQIDGAFYLNNSQRSAMGTGIKREPGRENTNAQTTFVPRRPAPHNESTNKVGTIPNERNKKRKATLDELEVIELEQNRLRLTQALGQMESDG